MAVEKSYGWNRPLVLAVLVSAALAVLALACSSPRPSGGEPAHAAVAYAVETPLPVSEPALPSDPAPEVEDHAAQAMATAPFQSSSLSGAPEDICPDRALDPLPTPGAPGSQNFFRGFREPLPPAPVWNPPGPKRVGIQAGHWRNSEVPQELRALIGSGTSGGGRAEWDLALDLAQRTAAILEGYGVEVDILPATVPPSYRAHAFISIHADGDLSGLLHGFKVARPGFSSIPETDDLLVQALYTQYGAATGLPRDDAHVSLRMLYYYAFNTRRYCHSIALGVPSAIIETGFMTNAADRYFLFTQPEAAAQGIARGVLSFLGLPAEQSAEQSDASIPPD